MLFTFQGAQGNVITVQATRSGGSGTFDPVIEVFSPSGLRLRRAGGGFSYVARIDTLTLPQDGLFTILIKDDDGADIATYDLSLNCLTCSPLLATWLHGPLLPSKTAKSLS